MRPDRKACLSMEEQRLVVWHFFYVDKVGVSIVEIHAIIVLLI